MNIQKLKIDNLDEQLGEKNARIETGPLQINKDWTGTFIRGDNAAYYVIELETILEIMTDEQKKTHWLAIAALRGIIGDLKSSRITFDS